MISEDVNMLDQSKADDNSVQANQNLTINCLKDDLLMHIFQYLTIDEKIKLESICKKWNRIVKLSWSHQTCLDVFRILKYKTGNNKVKKNKNYLKGVLKKCGVYLNKIIINKYQGFTVRYSLLSWETVRKLPEYVAKYCKNITELQLLEHYYNSPIMFTDENLKKIFCKNLNISSIHFSELAVKGDCLCHLNANLIKEFHLEKCKFESNSQFLAFLEKLKNLNKLIIKDNFEDDSQVIDALIRSKCINIFEMELNLYMYKNLDKISLLVSRQTKLRKLKLEEISINQKFLDNLPTGYLEELDIECRDSYGVRENILSFSFLSKHEKIRKLRLCNVLIDKEFLRNNCLKSLEEFDLKFDRGESEKIISCLLKFLSNHKNIRKLKLNKVDIDEKIMKCLPESLEELFLDHIEISFNQVLKYFERLKNLQFFKGKFGDLNYNFSTSSDEVKNALSVKKMQINFEYFSPVKRIPNLRKLHKLESLILDNDGDNIPDISNILGNLAECEKLNYLKIAACKVSSVGLNTISYLPNLKILDIIQSENTDDDFVDFVKNSVNLQALILELCSKITNDLIEKLSNVKVKRKDCQALKIFFDNCCQIDSFELDEFPLIDFKFV